MMRYSSNYSSGCTVVTRQLAANTCHATPNYDTVAGFGGRRKRSATLTGSPAQAAA